MAKRATLGTISSFMSQQTVKRLQKEKTTNWANLFSIRPDPEQPRRLLPPDLAQSFKAGEMSPQQVMQILRASEQGSITELRKLALSIAQHGLINPISVRDVDSSLAAPKEVKYIIVTGERRWWAHVLLFVEQRQIQEGETTVSPDKIKINLTAGGVSIRAHQMIENLVREDLNVVEKAQGMWALREELSIEPKKLAAWKSVEESLGISRAYRVRVTNVLKLTEEAIGVIQLHNLSERMVRPITQKLRDEPALQLQALNQLIAWQAEVEPNRSLVHSIKEYVDSLLAPEEPEGEESPQPESRPWATSPPETSEQSQERESRPWATSASQAEGEQSSQPESRPWATSASQTSESKEESDKLSQPLFSQFPTTIAKVTSGETLTQLIVMANAAGANAWQLDEPKYVKVSIMSKEGELQEYELPQPHQGILMLMFPKVAFDGNTSV